MATWYTGTDQIWDNGFGSSRNGGTIEGAMLHHVAGTNGQAYVANWNDRDSHPTYHVKSSGWLTGIVHPNKEPSSLNSKYSTVDRVSISFEIDNVSTGGDWPVSDAALNKVIDTCVFHARQQGYKKFAKNTPGKDQPGVFFIGWHQQYQSTSCPGPYILARIDWIVEECQRRLDGGSPAPTPTPEPVTGFERAPGGEPNAPMWPRGPLMERIQRALKNRTKFGEKSRYNGDIDGIGGENTAKGIQQTLNISRKNGIKPYVKTPEDGKLGINNAYGVQHYGKAFGNYRGEIDGDPLVNSWTAFAEGLEKP